MCIVCSWREGGSGFRWTMVMEGTWTTWAATGNAYPDDQEYCTMQHYRYASEEG